MRFIYVFLLGMAALTHAQTPQTPAFLYHWTNSRRFLNIEGMLAQGKVPLELPEYDRQNHIDAFYAADPDMAKTPAFFTFDDIVGGMGAGPVEFYAKMDLERGLEPRVIVSVVNPKARVKSIRTVIDVSKGRATSGPTPAKVKGTDLVYHEVGEMTSDGQFLPLFNEWVVLNQRAVTQVYYKPEDTRPFVAGALSELKNGHQFKNHSQDYDFNTNPEARKRAFDVLTFLSTGQGPVCNGAYRDTNQSDRSDSIFR